LADASIDDAAICHHADRNIEDWQRAFANDGDRASANRLFGKIVAVVIVAGNRDEHIAGPNLLPIARAAG
jgi:hypothetical protein